MVNSSFVLLSPMFKKHPIFFLFPFFLLMASACTSLSPLERIRQLEGEYQVQKGSEPSCQSGHLRIVGDGDDQGVRIGHHIYLGPFKDFIEPATKNSCRIISTFLMTKNEITSRTIVDKCPKKNEEGEAIQIFNFKNKEIIYTVVETGYKCIFLKRLL